MSEDKKGMPAEIMRLIGTVCLSISIVVAVVVLGNSIVKHRTIGVTGKSSISATGSASVDFESDLIVWRCNFSRHAESTKEAYSLLKKDADIIKEYFKDNGIEEKEYVFSSIDITQATKSVYNENGAYVREEANGYILSQTAVISSSNIDKVETISRDVSTLIDKDIRLDSYLPEYYYTKLSELKLSLIKSATENARQRIEIMAEASGGVIDKLLSSNLGVFQITAINTGTSNYGYDGSFDTSSRRKTAHITVKLDYSLK